MEINSTPIRQTSSNLPAIGLSRRRWQAGRGAQSHDPRDLWGREARLPKSIGKQVYFVGATACPKK